MFIVTVWRCATCRGRLFWEPIEGKGQLGRLCCLMCARERFVLGDPRGQLIDVSPRPNGRARSARLKG